MLAVVGEKLPMVILNTAQSHVIVQSHSQPVPLAQQWGNHDSAIVFETDVSLIEAAVQRWRQQKSVERVYAFSRRSKAPRLDVGRAEQAFGNEAGYRTAPVPHLDEMLPKSSLTATCLADGFPLR